MDSVELAAPDVSELVDPDAIRNSRLDCHEVTATLAELSVHDLIDANCMGAFRIGLP